MIFVGRCHDVREAK